MNVAYLLTALGLIIGAGFIGYVVGRLLARRTRSFAVLGIVVVVQALTIGYGAHYVLELVK